MGFIYALSLDGVNHRYIGQTIRTVEQRRRAHLSQARRRGTNWPVHDWIRKYEQDEPIVSVMIEEVPDSDLGERERYWISYFREQGYDLLNLSDGGPSRLGAKLSAEHLEALRYERTPETRARMSESAKRRGANNKGKPMSEEQKKKLRQAHLGKVVSDEGRLNMSLASRGKPKTPEHAAKIAASLKAYHERRRSEHGS